MQGRVLRELAATSFDEQAALLAAARRITLVGTGSSLHAAQLGAWLLRRHGLDARALSSLDQARWEPAPRAGDALVVISHTGRTAYTQRVRADALACGVPLVSITGSGAGWPEAIVTPVREQSDTYSASYLATLGVLSRLADGIDRALGTAAGRPGMLALLDAADRVEASVAAPEIDRIAVPDRALVIVGTGPWAVTAREGALKVREAARVLAEGYDSELLLHGSAVPLRAGDTVLALQPGADPDGLVDSLAAAAHAEGVTVATLEDERAPADPFYAQFPLTARLQLLAAQFATRRGQDPDVAIVGCWSADSLWRAGSPVVAVH